MKQKIEQQEDIPSEQQRLIFGGRQLEDDKTIAHYGIDTGAIVHLVLRLC